MPSGLADVACELYTEGKEIQTVLSESFSYRPSLLQSNDPSFCSVRHFVMVYIGRFDSLLWKHRACEITNAQYAAVG